MRKQLLLLFVLICFASIAQSKRRKYSNLFIDGETGHKFSLNYNSHTNFLMADIGIMKYDAFPESMANSPNEYLLMNNHNMFIASEINLNKQFLFGPKVGYELNLLFLSTRLNLIDYFDLKGNNNICFRPEIGPTLLGVFSIRYGYNFNLTHTQRDICGKHVITLSGNLFY